MGLCSDKVNINYPIENITKWEDIRMKQQVEKEKLIKKIKIERM